MWSPASIFCVIVPSRKKRVSECTEKMFKLLGSHFKFWCAIWTCRLCIFCPSLRIFYWNLFYIGDRNWLIIYVNVTESPSKFCKVEFANEYSQPTDDWGKKEWGAYGAIILLTRKAGYKRQEGWKVARKWPNSGTPLTNGDHICLTNKFVNNNKISPFPGCANLLRILGDYYEFLRGFRKVAPFPISPLFLFSGASFS